MKSIEDKQGRALLSGVTRYTVLLSITITSTLIMILGSMIAAIFGFKYTQHLSLLLFAIDTAVNTICIYLNYDLIPHSDIFYEKHCQSLDTKVLLCCLSNRIKKSDNPNLIALHNQIIKEKISTKPPLRLGIRTTSARSDGSSETRSSGKGQRRLSTSPVANNHDDTNINIDNNNDNKNDADNNNSNGAGKTIDERNYLYKPNQEETVLSVQSKYYSATSEIVSTHVQSWKPVEVCYICNPLVVLLGIGKYDGHLDLNGVKTDYKNMVHTFHDVWGYSIIYKTSLENENKLIKPESKPFKLSNDNNNNNNSNNNKVNSNINKNINAKIKNQSCKCQQKRYYKLEWTCEEIDEYCQHISNEIEKGITNRKGNKKIKDYDGLIFIISCHGESDGVILDSKCEEVSLLNIYGFFQSKECPKIADKPKIFMIDACRGSMREKPQPFVREKGISVDTKSSKTTIAASTDADDSNYEKDNKDNKENKDKDDNKGDERTERDARKNDDHDNDEEKKTDADVEDKNGGTIAGDNTHADVDKFHRESNFYKIYANPAGFASIEGTKGGILIHSIKNVFCNIEQVVKSNLDDIFRQISIQSINQSKYLSIQLPETQTTTNFIIKFGTYNSKVDS